MWLGSGRNGAVPCPVYHVTRLPCSTFFLVVPLVTGIIRQSGFQAIGIIALAGNDSREPRQDVMRPLQNQMRIILVPTACSSTMILTSHRP